MTDIANKEDTELYIEINKFFKERFPPKDDEIWKDKDRVIELLRTITKEFVKVRTEIVVNIEFDKLTGTLHISAYPKVEKINFKFTLGN